MKTYLIALTSITFALRAQSLLIAEGYICEVERTPKSLVRGCGYSIKIKGDIKKILEILQAHKIPIRAYKES